MQNSTATILLLLLLPVPIDSIQHGLLFGLTFRTRHARWRRLHARNGAPRSWRGCFLLGSCIGMFHIIYVTGLGIAVISILLGLDGAIGMLGKGDAALRILL